MNERPNYWPALFLIAGIAFVVWLSWLGSKWL
jgi:hypothetical protein